MKKTMASFAKKSLLILALLSFAVHASWSPVPGGLQVHEDCITEIPHGMVVDGHDTDTGSCKYPVLKRENATAGIQIYAADVHLQKQDIEELTADFIVPPLPSSAAGQVVYFWPGFKSSQPEMGYPVLQPVLQYGQHGQHYELQSWFVDANQPIRYPVVTGKAIRVYPGDELTTYMKLDGDVWSVVGIDKTTGSNSTLQIAKKRAGNCVYDFAMLVNENINVDNRCARMPATAAGLIFTNITLNGKRPDWTTRANCKGDPRCDCANSASVDPDSGDVTLGWSAEA